MIEVNQIYKCNVCGNIIQILHAGGGDLICCGQLMELLKENTVDASLEKHVPVVEKTQNGYKVKVGAIPHPMEEKHYIMWIQLISGDMTYRKHLKPGDAPEAEFCVPQNGEVIAREYCNLHGLWKA